MTDEKKNKLTGEMDPSRRSMIKGLALVGTAVAASSMFPVETAEAARTKKKSAAKKKRSKKKASKKKR